MSPWDEPREMYGSAVISFSFEKSSKMFIILRTLVFSPSQFPKETFDLHFIKNLSKQFD
jgi:hypothetical protein